MDRFFPYVPELLSDHGMFYLVTIKENDIGITLSYSITRSTRVIVCHIIFFCAEM